MTEECLNINEYPEFTLKKDTILYSGGRENTDSCPDYFKYKGQEGYMSRGKKLWLSTSEIVANGYAMCGNTREGWVKKYKVKQDINLLDISSGLNFLYSHELTKCLCDKGINGYYLNWGGTNGEEIALCNSPEVLQYLESKQCITSQTFSEYKCVNNRGGSEKKYNKSKYYMANKRRSRRISRRSNRSSRKGMRRRRRTMRGGHWINGVVGAHSGYSVAGVTLPPSMLALANPAPFISRSMNI